MKHFILLIILLFTSCHKEDTMEKTLKLNTSNQGKFEEFKRLFAKHGLTLIATHEDLPEIDADPVTVVAHKASSVPENVIIEDTSLDVEGAKVGINVRWLLDHLKDYAGKKATWTVLLAMHHNNTVVIYKGEVTGTIVQPEGQGGFGFDPVFLPDGCEHTLAEQKPDSVNARAKAVDALVKNQIYKQVPVIKEWHGRWQ